MACGHMPAGSVLGRYGLKRLVRDVLAISGRVHLDGQGRPVQVVLNRASALAWAAAEGLKRVLQPQQVDVILDEI